MTQTCVHLLETWNLDELQLETLYLKNKLASHLKVKYRSDTDPITKRYNMINYTEDVLRQNIKDVICPNADNSSGDIDSLIENVTFN